MKTIEISSLSKNYKKFQALSDVNLELSKGKIIGLFGKNGAGKSTLMRCILGFLKCQGNIKIMGRDVSHRDPNLFLDVAFIPDVDGLDGRLTVAQTITYISTLNPHWNTERANHLLSISNLPLGKKVKQLSKGMKTKLYLLITLSLDVKILILDEPTLGLDLVFRKEFYNQILGDFFDEDKTILISTHQVEEVEHILHEIIFIDEGKIILHEDIEELKNRYNVITVPFEMKEDLMQHNPKYVTKSLGTISGIVDSFVKIDGALYSRPMLSDLFIAEVGGYNESI